MSRGVIKEETYSLEDTLKKGERLQTDAEWYADLLEAIQAEQESTNILLKDIYYELKGINEYYENNPRPYIVEQRPIEPAWRVIFNGLIFLIAVVGLVIYLSRS